jgi:ATP-binding cassette, subfamily B, multidrug efflux pump
LQAQAKATQGRPARPKGKGGLGRSLRYLQKHQRVYIITYAALLVATLTQLVVPKLVELMINNVTFGSLAQQIPQLGWGLFASQAKLTVEQVAAYHANAQTWLVQSTLVLIVFSIGRGVFAFAQAYLSENLSQGVAFDLRNDIFNRIQRLSFSYYDRTQTGQLMIRATDDVDKVRLFVAQGLTQAVQSAVLLIGTLIVLFLTNWQLTLWILPILPIVVVIFGIFGAISGPLFAEVQRRLSALNTVLQEALAGIKVVKAFVQEAREQQRFNAAADDVLGSSLKTSRTFAFLFPVVFLIAQLGQVMILYASSSQILNGTLTQGGYQQFSLYLILVFIPLGQLGFIIAQLSQAAASADRIFEILDAKSEVTNKPNALELQALRGQVEFRNVTFRYFGGSDPVLQDVSLIVQPGQTVALLGMTGSGKTTIINLIPRFYDVSEGAVLIDGHDIRDVTIDSLRGNIGIVLQETNLFSGTLRDNIAFGRSDATDEQVIAAAKAAAAHDFISQFPQGYDTPVGERGATLSGGQKQRIAIARALLLDPRLLILDDSTSSIDFATEAQIQAALDTLMQGRTSFVIAQRISTVAKADLILVLDKGQIVAQGTHADLLETSAIYAEIYNSQLIGDTKTTDEVAAITA